jgi:DinB superfamily
MDAIAQLRQDFQSAHGFLEGTIQGVDGERAHWTPPGVANPLGANYAHVAFAEDGMINGLIRKGAPLFASRFAGRTGVSAPPPQGGAWDAWAREVRVDLSALREYANAVYAETDGWLGSLAAGDLQTEVDLSMAGQGQQTVSRVLGILVGNSWMHCGEAACLKGLQGLKGYPM